MKQVTWSGNLFRDICSLKMLNLLLGEFWVRVGDKTRVDANSCISFEAII